MNGGEFILKMILFYRSGVNLSFIFLSVKFQSN